MEAKVTDELRDGLLEEWLIALVLFHNSSDKVEALSSVEVELHQMREVDENNHLLLLHELAALDCVVLDFLALLEVILCCFNVSDIVGVLLVEHETID